MTNRAQVSSTLARINDAVQDLHEISGHIALAEQDLNTVQLISTAFADLTMFLGDANLPVTMPAKTIGAILGQLLARIENSAEALANASALITVLRNQISEGAQ